MWLIRSYYPYLLLWSVTLLSCSCLIVFPLAPFHRLLCSLSSFIWIVLLSSYKFFLPVIFSLLYYSDHLLHFIYTYSAALLTGFYFKLLFFLLFHHFSNRLLFIDYSALLLLAALLFLSSADPFHLYRTVLLFSPASTCHLLVFLLTLFHWLFSNQLLIDTVNKIWP